MGSEGEVASIFVAPNTALGNTTNCAFAGTPFAGDEVTNAADVPNARPWDNFSF